MGSSSLKRKRAAQPEEITFDFAARQDYLTGFHKRKLQRAKHAQEDAAKKEREERIRARKILREERQARLEKHIEAVNGMTGKIGRSSEDEASEEGEHNSIEWQGSEQPAIVDREDEFVDEDRHTTVTVEAVDVTRHGLERVPREDEEDASEDEDQNGRDANRKASMQPLEKAKRIWTKENPHSGKKKKRKKFRYESKKDRKVTQIQQRKGNREKARSRRQQT